jgi:hypothetical protein
MASDKRKKKDGADPGKKRQRMRADVKRRRAQAGEKRPSRDETDKIKYKKGSAGDRTQRGAR